MSIEIKVPPLPESVSDATLVAWHKSAGESVSRDENLVDLETDKVVLEVPAPASGTITKIVVENGATVVAGDVLAILEAGEVAADAAAAAPAAVAEKAMAPAATKAGGPVKTSPAVRRLLEEHDLDATMVLGTGKDGRITKSDVMSFLKSDDSSNVTPGDPAPAVAETVAVGLERTEQRVPMTRFHASATAGNLFARRIVARNIPMTIWTPIVGVRATNRPMATPSAMRCGVSSR